MTDQQRAILTAIITKPHATLHEIKLSLSHGEHSFLTQKQIKYAMDRFGITRERHKGSSYVFAVPDAVRAEIDAGAAPTVMNKVNRVWTKPMTQAPHMRMLHFHGNRMRIA